MLQLLDVHRDELKEHVPVVMQIVRITSLWWDKWRESSGCAVRRGALRAIGGSQQKNSVDKAADDKVDVCEGDLVREDLVVLYVHILGDETDLDVCRKSCWTK